MLKTVRRRLWNFSKAIHLNGRDAARRFGFLAYPFVALMAALYLSLFLIVEPEEFDHDPGN